MIAPLSHILIALMISAPGLIPGCGLSAIPDRLGRAPAVFFALPLFGHHLPLPHSMACMQGGGFEPKAAWHGMPGMARHCMARHDPARSGMARHSVAQRSMAWHSAAWHGTAQRSMAAAFAIDFTQWSSSFCPMS
ncbi:MAG: hypothetical protein LBJ10_06455 [Clostridiales bacterium]|nr:hypothetical protein [Clostridiales bacterium]